MSPPDLTSPGPLIPRPPPSRLAAGKPRAAASGGAAGRHPAGADGDPGHRHHHAGPFQQGSAGRQRAGQHRLFPDLADGLRHSLGGGAGDRAYPGRAQQQQGGPRPPRRAHRRAHGPVVGRHRLPAADGRPVLHPAHPAFLSPAAVTGGRRRRLCVGDRHRPALCPGLSGAAQLLDRLVARRAPDGGAAPRHSLQCAGRLRPDLRAFRFPAPGHPGRGLRQRQLEHLRLRGDAGGRAGLSGAEALPHPAPADPGGLEDLPRTVPAGPSHRHHHGVRGGAVQRRGAGDGHLWPGAAGSAPDRHHHSLHHLHGAAGHWSGGHGARRAGGGRGRSACRAPRGLRRHHHVGGLHVRHGAGAAALAAPDRRPVAARHSRQCRCAGPCGELPRRRRGVSVDGRHPGGRQI